ICWRLLDKAIREDQGLPNAFGQRHGCGPQSHRERAAARRKPTRLLRARRERPSVAKNFRRAMWLAMCPPGRGSFMQWRDDITLPPRGLFPIGKSRECFRMAAWGRVSRAPTRVLAARNCSRDEGGPFGFGNQVLISSHRKLLRSKVVVESVAETPGQDPSRHGRERRA